MPERFGIQGLTSRVAGGGALSITFFDGSNCMTENNDWITHVFSLSAQ